MLDPAGTTEEHPSYYLLLGPMTAESEHSRSMVLLHQLQENYLPPMSHHEHMLLAACPSRLSAGLQCPHLEAMILAPLLVGEPEACLAEAQEGVLEYHTQGFQPAVQAQERWNSHEVLARSLGTCPISEDTSAEICSTEYRKTQALDHPQDGLQQHLLIVGIHRLLILVPVILIPDILGSNLVLKHPLL